MIIPPEEPLNFQFLLGFKVRRNERTWIRGDYFQFLLGFKKLESEVQPARSAKQLSIPFRIQENLIKRII